MNIDTDAIITGYIEAMLWSSPDSMDETIEYLDEQYRPEDVHPTEMARIRQDVDAFLALCARASVDMEAVIASRRHGPEEVGHDLWLTRNRHGAGFWDGDYPDHGDALTAAAKTLGECYPYTRDGRVYIEYDSPRRLLCKFCGEVIFDLNPHFHENRPVGACCWDERLTITA